MGIKEAILATTPTSYWPLDDASGTACHDERGLHEASLGGGVKLAVVPFGQASAPYFDGEIGSYLTIVDDERYSQPHANALSVAAWICPLTLNNTHTAGGSGNDQYVHFMEKSIDTTKDVEWAMRFYNKSNPSRHSRLSFYTFNTRLHAGEGNGSYMEYGKSANDVTPIELGKWIFVVGQAEQWNELPGGSYQGGDIFWKQDVQAARSPGDQYETYKVHPTHGAGPLRIGGVASIAYKGSVAHVAIWNRLISAADIKSIWNAGLGDLQATPMYHSFV
jgi:hypothetical protein